MRGQWRKIAHMEFYRVRCKEGYGSYLMTLDCGHKVGFKKSESKNKFVGSKVKCIQCPDLKQSCEAHCGKGEDVINCPECNEEFEEELNNAS